MASISQYTESGINNHIYRGIAWPRPSSICIALTSGVPSRTDTGATLQEIPTSINGSGTGYSRLNLGNPVTSGSSLWDMNVSGALSNHAQMAFNTALLDWGWVSGMAFVDSPVIGSGNVIEFAEMSNPRDIRMGDNPRFDATTLEIILT